VPGGRRDRSPPRDVPGLRRERYPELRDGRYRRHRATLPDGMDARRRAPRRRLDVRRPEACRVGACAGAVSGERPALASRVPPRAEYEARASARREVETALRARAERASRARTWTFAAALALVFLAFDFRVVPGWLVAVPVSAFATLVVVHQRTRIAERRAGRAA